MVANTVLYVQYKAARGEEIGETAVEGEVSGDYVSLAVNEKKTTFLLRRMLMEVLVI